MSGLTRDDILHVAKLSNLTLSEAEIKKFTSQLSAVVEYISGLSEIDTRNTDPTSQTTGLTNSTRKDEIKALQILPVEQALLNAHETHNNYFQVPPVLKKDKNKLESPSS
jgi:aspartyl-tRNA(Asn)/glutamyl-tRNA(Gln) amidotransferase subunit C